MFPKREPQEGEVYCPYDGIAYSKVPGYISGYGCPVCGGIGQYHLPVQKSAQQSVHPTVLTHCPNDGCLLLMGFCDQCKTQYPHSG